MATTKLDKTDCENRRPQKGVSQSSIASVNLTTSFQKIGDTYDLGNNPSAAGLFDWTIASGTTLTVRVKVSMDNSVFQYAPSIGSPTTGTSEVDIAEMTFSSSTWDVGSSVSRCPVELLLPRWRYFQFWIKSNNASGSITGTVIAGTDS